MASIPTALGGKWGPRMGHEAMQAIYTNDSYLPVWLHEQ